MSKLGIPQCTTNHILVKAKELKVFNAVAIFSYRQMILIPVTQEGH